jgi:hypothetical protein
VDKDDEREVVAAPPTTKPHALDRAIAEVAEAGRAMLAGTGLNRFAEAARVCQVGHQLQRAKAESLEDFAALHADADAHQAGVNVLYAGGAGMVDMNPIVMGPRVGPHRAARWVGGMAQDDHALADPGTRRLLLLLEPMLQVQRGTQAAEAARSEATELKDLIAVREALEGEARQTIERRIAALVESIDMRSAAKRAQGQAAEGEREHGKLALVSADVPRGHPLGAQNGANDHPQGLRADGPGGEGP